MRWATGARAKPPPGATQMSFGDGDGGGDGDGSVIAGFWFSSPSPPPPPSPKNALTDLLAAPTERHVKSSKPPHLGVAQPIQPHYNGVNALPRRVSPETRRRRMPTPFLSSEE